VFPKAQFFARLAAVFVANPRTGTTIGKALEKFDGRGTDAIKVLSNLK
jgi:hypothetical protein